MKLVYVSPVPYASYSQRPHHFVEYFKECTGAKVLWIEPYPGRFPRLSDLGRPRMGRYVRASPSARVWSPPMTGSDPVMSIATVRRFLLRRTMAAVREFVVGGDWLLVIGRPSFLALELLRQGGSSASCYDAMDDFPEFYRGLSRAVSRRIEMEIARRTDAILVSSTALEKKFSRCGLDVELVRNGADWRYWRARSGNRTAPPVFGYVGTIGAWFDWALVVKMARALGGVRFDLVGPVIERPGVALPDNVRLLGECSSEEVPERLDGFAAGLIPFRINRLTDAIDPVKYYEYRCAGLPVISTRFGDMRWRGSQVGVYLVDHDSDFVGVREEMEGHRGEAWESADSFREENSWRSRFEHSRFFLEAVGSGERPGSPWRKRRS